MSTSRHCVSGLHLKLFHLDRRLTFDKEKEAIKEKLKHVENWQARLKEIDAELAFKRA